jgi:hypothetical protein
MCNGWDAFFFLCGEDGKKNAQKYRQQAKDRGSGTNAALKSYRAKRCWT